MNLWGWLIRRTCLNSSSCNPMRTAVSLLTSQCPEGQAWSKDDLLVLLDEIIGKYRVDTNRVYLTGLSMGGYGTWSLALSYPEKFAAIAPICGGGELITVLVSDPERG